MARGPGALARRAGAGLLALLIASGAIPAGPSDRLLVALAEARSALPPECAPEGAAGFRCLYRSPVPSSGLVAVCREEGDCRVGYYYGDPAAPVWLQPPAPLAALPLPLVSWPTPTLGEIRFECGPACRVSYFLEVKRHRVSEPRWSVLALDSRRLLVAQVEGRTLVIRQVYSGREVAQIDRDWAPGPSIADTIDRISFDPDGRLSLAWRRGAARAPVSERITVPSFPRP